MGRSLPLGTVFGIRLQVHWTFLFVILFVVLLSVSAGNSVAETLLKLGFVAALFSCVVLHELGHALAARYFGIPTKDITLLPIGGVARLTRVPRKPLQEIVVALAGPAVNVVIASVLLAVLLPSRGASVFTQQGRDVWQQLLFVNIALVLFNMLPAFPLDGGRVLRAVLATFLTYSRATRLAATVGQVCAVCLAFLGLANPFLFIIAAFIFLGAAAESRQVIAHEELAEVRVGDAMLRRFHAVSDKTPIRTVAAQMLDGSQRDYPVVCGASYVGMLTRKAVFDALQREGNVLAEDVMVSHVAPVHESDPLNRVLETAPERAQLESLPVTSAGRLTGLLDFRQMMELVRARANLRRAESLFTTPANRTPSPNPS